MELLGFFSLVMFIFILILLFISFVYIYLYIAKKEKLLKQQGFQHRKDKKKQSLQERMILTLVLWGKKAGPVGIRYPFFADKAKHERLLKEAGNPLELSLQDFYGFRFVLGLIGLGFGSIYSFLGMPLGLQVLLLSILGGFLGPSAWLYFKAKNRQELITIMMPDFLDTVSVTLQAGVSLDNALQQVTQQFEGPLSEEIDRFNREIDLGVPRITAYQSLMDRNSSKELHSLVNGLIQGSTLGVPVSRTFKLQADDLRATRGFVAKEKAAKASPQITLVTTFFVAPAVFGLIIGLLVLNIMYNPAAFGLDSFFFK
ncbi:type II secretion system F family protein [Bacillus sp. FJAT-29790]|uniref:type II secretion system F family protein n=1 Tax=Bacillus sp. FJAT-29790 TaxID=1895002 RepID=UPI001C2199F1|nr:type II secretion system F family protein [Bacillus sp. FJAT-29790]MBU8881365.1 type II secretion system F family protein [Bacillus sp. FJAT-29790]